MALGDIQPFENTGASKTDGAIKALVVSGTTASIKAGEPVQKLAGVAGASQFPNNGPTATIRIMGVAASTSNETASVAGTVDVIPANPGQLWLIAPKVAASWNTQALYNGNVGKRVLIDLTTGVYTLLAADGAGNGCIVEYLDITRYPGQVAISFSPLCDYRNV
jgi:hypothetical protein